MDYQSRSFPAGLDELENVKAAVDEFVAEAPQFDDITMLSIEIKTVKNTGYTGGVKYDNQQDN